MPRGIDDEFGFEFFAGFGSDTAVVCRMGHHCGLATVPGHFPQLIKEMLLQLVLIKQTIVTVMASGLSGRFSNQNS